MTNRCRHSDPGLLDNPDNQGNEIHDETVEDRYKTDLDAAGDNVFRNVIMCGHEISYLKPA